MLVKVLILDFIKIIREDPVFKKKSIIFVQEENMLQIMVCPVKTGKCGKKLKNRLIKAR